MSKVARDADSIGLPFRFLNGRFDRKVTSSETAGALCVFDTVRTEPGGPPLHIHDAQDEWFLVTEGTFDVRVGETIHKLEPGDSIVGPRGVPHTSANTSVTGRIVVAFAPAGVMEAFFERGSQRGKMTPAELAELSAEHGMRVVGPPLQG